MRFCYHCMHQVDETNQRFCPNCNRELSAKPVLGKFLPPGTILQGRFVVGYPLGAGGFGNTYIGWNMLLSRRVAIKEFFPKQYIGRGADGVTVTVSHPGMQSRFKKGLQDFMEEARYIAKLQDIPGLVAVSNYFEEYNTGYIIMEYLEGQDVRKLLQQSGGRMDYEQSRKIILSVLNTLKELHEHGILHRDIAPDNVFVTKEGIIKLIDFGAARQTFVSENQNAEIILKMGYSPVEQYTRNAPQGPYTDLYAVAALFYKMLTGQKPAPANDRLEKDTLLPPSEMGIQIPQQSEYAIMVCLNIQPEYRLQSAENFIEALDGKDFTPQYEPKVVLKQEEQPRNFTRNRLLALIGVFFLFCMGMTGIYLSQSGSKGEPIPDNQIVTMKDLNGMTQKKAEKYIAELNQENDWNIKVEWGSTVFDLTKNDTVCSQSVKAGTILSDSYEKENIDGQQSEAEYSKPDETEVLSVESSPEESQSTEELAEGLYSDEKGMIYGTLTCSLYSNSTINYEEIRALNAYQLAKMLDIDTSESSGQFIGEESEAAGYFDILKLKAGGEEISAEDLQKDEGTISYNKGEIVIVYAKTPFYYWDSLPDFVNTDWGNGVGNISGIAFPVYQKKSEDDSELEACSEENLFESNFVQDYYSLSDSWPAGTVIEQTIPAGEKVDTSNRDWDKNGDGILLHVIKKQLSLEGKSGYSAKQEIEDTFGENVTVECAASRGSLDMNQKVLGVWISDSEGKEIESGYFKKDDAVTIHLMISPKPTPKVQSDSSSGSSSGAGNASGNSGSSGGVSYPHSF